MRPEGGNDITTTASSRNWKAVFTGIVDATILRFNPTKKEIVELKGLPDEVAARLQEPKYTNVEVAGKKYTRLSILAKINPNEVLNETDDEGNLVKEYRDEHFFNIDFLISNRDEESSKGNKRFINGRLQSTWGSSLEDIASNPNMSWFKTDDARPCKEGEWQLYNFLYAWYNKSNSQDNPIKNFHLGEDDATEAFLELVSGNVEELNDILDPDSDSFEYFSIEQKVGDADETVKRNRKVAVLLGVKPSDSLDSDGNPYLNQRVFTNGYVSTFAKEGRDIPKKAKEAVEEGRFNADVQGYDFSVYDPAKVDIPKTEIKNEIEDGDDFSILEDTDF
jgi:hypothetical protein